MKFKNRRNQPVSTAKRPARMIKNNGVGNGNPPDFMKKAALVLLCGLGILLAAGILMVIRAAFP